jgi:hypothetical protein
MRQTQRALTIAAVVAVLLAFNTAGFATAFSHSGPIAHSGNSTSHPFAAATPSPLIYFQNPDFNGAWSSQNDTTVGGFGNFATTYDNFTLSATYNIDEFAWIGSYFNPSQQGTITAFTLSFYADAGNQPGALLWTATGGGNFGETFLGIDNAGDPTFLYDGTLSGFLAQAGVQYWVSIVPDLAFPPQWGWETSTDADNYSWQVFFGTGGPLPTDESFALYGTQAVPEPGTLVLMGSGLLGLAGIIRRKMS